MYYNTCFDIQKLFIQENTIVLSVDYLNIYGASAWPLHYFEIYLFLQSLKIGWSFYDQNADKHFDHNFLTNQLKDTKNMTLMSTL